MIRKLLTIVEETHAEAGRAIAPPTRKAAAIAVVANPFAGRYVEDLEPLDRPRRGAGATLGRAGGGGPRDRARERAELRQGRDRGRGWRAGARGGDPAPQARRARCARRSASGAALIPSAKKRGGPGCAIDVPLGHKDAAFVRSHFDAMEVRVPDAPRRDEIVVAVVVTDSGRPLPRIGGLTADQHRGQGRTALNRSDGENTMTRITRRAALGGTIGGTVSLLAAPAILRAQSTAPIRIGEINSYTAHPRLHPALPQRLAAGGRAGERERAACSAARSR